MIKKEDLKQNTIVRCIKYNTYEIIDSVGKMKTPDGWKEAVFYHGIDRLTGENCQFSKLIDEFVPDFELADDNVKIAYVLKSYFTNNESEINCISESGKMCLNMKETIEETKELNDVVLDHCELYTIVISKDANAVLIENQTMLVCG